MSTTTVRPSLDELERTLRDPAQLRNMLAENKFGDFVKDYADAKMAANDDLARLVQEETQRVMAQMLKDSGGVVRKLNLDLKNRESGTVRNVARGKGAVYNKKAPGAAIDNSDSKPEDMAEFLQAIWQNVGSLPNSEELQAKAAQWKKIANSYGSTVPADGGFLIPEELRADLLQLAMEDAVVRPRAQVIPMSTLAVPIPCVDETSRASSVFGGMVAYWTEEGAAATQSQASFGRVRLEAKKLTIYSEAPNELVADAPAFEAFISTNMPRATAFEEDYKFITGNGAGEPKGVLSTANSGLIQTTRQAATGINFQDVINVFTRLLPGSYGRAVWLCAPDLIPDLLKLVLPTGGTGNETVAPPLWLTGQQAIQGAPATLLGVPLIITEKVPARDTTGDLSLIDFSHYLIGDRQAMQATSSPHFKFSSDVTAYKVVERVDGQPWVQSPLTPRNASSNTLSPYVTVGPT